MARKKSQKAGYWSLGMSSWFKKALGIGGTGERARNKKGHYKKDDLSTTDVNEAYVDGRTPAERNKRARGAKGKFKADDKSTKKKNEAYKGGKAPKKKRGRPRKKK